MTMEERYIYGEQTTGIKRYASLLLSLALIFSLSGLAPPGEAEAASSKYKKFFDISKKGAAIPGYSEPKSGFRKGWLLFRARIGSLYRIIGAIRTAIKPAAFRLQAAKPTNVSKPCICMRAGAKHTGHVGGLAVSKTSVGGVRQKVYKIPLSTISSKKDYGNIVMTPYALGHKASYATYSDGILWIGEYMDGEDQGASSVRRDLRASCEAIH